MFAIHHLFYMRNLFFHCLNYVNPLNTNNWYDNVLIEVAMKISLIDLLVILKPMDCRNVFRKQYPVSKGSMV